MARTYYSAIEALESRIAPAGVITATLQGGTLVIEGDIEANQLTISQSSPNTLVLSSSTGLIELDLPGNSDPEPAGTVAIRDFAGSLVINLGGGNDSLTMESLLVAKNLTIDAGAGSNVVTLNATQVGGNVKISGGDDGNSIQIPTLRAKGSIAMSLGEGNDNIQAAFIGAKSMNISLGGGDDVFGAVGVQVSGALKVDGGNGGNVITLGSASVDVGGKISVVHGNDSLPDTTQIIGGHARFGSLLVENGNAAGGTILAPAVLDSGAIKVVNGAAGGVVVLNTQLASVKSVTVIGGAGMDNLQISSPNLDIAGNVVFNAGAGDDSILLSGNGRIGGKLALDLGSGTDLQTANIIGDRILSIKSVSATGQSAASNIVVLSRVDVKGSVQGSLSGDHDQLRVESSLVKGAFKAVLGDGDDELNLVSSTLRGAVSIKTGAGEDRLNIFGSSVVEARFDKPVKILLEGGNDIITVGSSNPDERVVFRNKVTFDGGEGMDSSLFSDAAIFPNNQPRLISFEPM